MRSGHDDDDYHLHSSDIDNLEDDKMSDELLGHRVQARKENSNDSDGDDDNQEDESSEHQSRDVRRDVRQFFVSPRGRITREMLPVASRVLPVRKRTFDCDSGAIVEDDILAAPIQKKRSSFVYHLNIGTDKLTRYFAP
jgi:hypothetical protein